MEKLLDVLVNAPVISITASIIAVITALMENHGNGNSTRHNIVIAILAFSIAGIIVEYLPEQNIFISTFIGLMSGMIVDDLFDKASSKMPDFIDKTLDIVLSGIKKTLAKIFGVNK